MAVMALWSALFSRPAPTPLPARPSLTLFFLLAGSFLLTLVPHAVQFPLWLSVGVVAAMVLRSIIEVYRLPLPSITFCSIMALLLLGAVLWQFQTVGGREAGTALTAGLLAIKFYELRRPRDVSLIIFSCFFLVMSALLYSQVLELFIYCLIMMWVLTALLLRVQTGDLPQDRLLRMLGQSGIIFLQALPLALFLFFFFPRYTGPLSISLEDPSIGLTDTVSPGSIAKLAQNDSEAMYVHFISGNPPIPDSMYWRALVLWDYRNGAWTPGPFAAVDPDPPPSAAPGDNRVVQEISIQPHNQKWLFALDAPIQAADNPAEPPFWATLLNGDVLQLTNNGKLDYKTRYTVTSATTLADEELRPQEKIWGTQRPHSSNDRIDPQVTALADRLHHGLSDDQTWDYIYIVIHYFRHGGFSYSLTPGRQGPDWLPVFLFKTRTGFCEHFASAFALLMRLENIPARLVVGYLGAEHNPYTDNYIVRQSNAHAWDEVWIRAKNQPASGEKGRWVRIDPTALLTRAEERLPANPSGNADDTVTIRVARHQLTFSEAYLPAWARDSLKEIQLRREQVETDWDNLVFSYNPETQGWLAEKLGFGRQARFELLMVCLVTGGLCLIVFQKWMARAPPASPVENLYAAFCRNMARRGIPRAAWEGPLAYTERVAEAFPDDKPALQRVGSIVAHARYGPAPADPAAPDDLKSLLTLVTASHAASSSRDRR
jgi:transglutaminase-like putative cysteine protease